MNSFITFLQSDWAELAGWALLHSLWQIALLTAVYAFALFLLRNRSANSRYFVGCLTLFAMLVLPLGTYLHLSQDVTPEIADTTTSITAVLPSQSRVPQSDIDQRADVSASPIPVKTDGASPKAVVPARSTTDFSSRLRQCLPWITATWLLGVLLLSLRPLWGWVHVRRLRRHGLSPLAEIIQDSGRRVMERLRVKRKVQFVQSALVVVPSVVGYFRPMVLLPASAVTGLGTTELELILAHELAHVKRHDWLVNLVQTVIEALLFYHPGMWWVSGQIRKERENCCDDMAVAMGGDRGAYVRALAQFEHQRVSAAAIAVAVSGGSLLDRARRLLGKPPRSCNYYHCAAWLAGLITMGFVAAALAMSSDGGSTYFKIVHNHRQGEESGGLIKAEKTGTCAAGSAEFRLALQDKTDWPWWRSNTIMYVLGRPADILVPDHIFLAHFAGDGGLPDRAYEIRVEENGVVVQANHELGFQRAAERFVGLMEADGENWRVPVGSYAWDPNEERQTAVSEGVEPQDKPDRQLEQDVATEEKTLPKLKVRAVDKQGEPIADAWVLLYDFNNFMAGQPVDFEQISKQTDDDGWVDLGTLPQDYVCAQINGRKDAFGTTLAVIYEDEEEGFRQCSPENRLIDLESDEEKNTVTLVFEMRRRVDLDFKIIDRETGEDVYWPNIYYQAEPQGRWWSLAVIDAGGQQNFTTIVEEMRDMPFRVAAVGYYPVEFRLDKKLELDKKIVQRVEMKPAPEIRFTVLTPDGEPAEGAEFECISPKELGNILNRHTPTDGSGKATKRYPAQAELARFVVTHSSGRAVVPVADLPEPITVEADGESKEVIPCEVRLKGEETETPVEPKLLPTLKVRAVGKDGKPIAGAKVWGWDKYSVMIGEPEEFEQFFGETDNDGWADLGKLPHDFVCVAVVGRPGVFDPADVVIDAGEEGVVQAGPPRRHLRLEFDEATNTLTLRFEVRRGVDLKFDIVDAESGETFQRPTVYVQEGPQGTWWPIALIDADGQRNLTTIVEEMGDMLFRVAAVGYYPIQFRLDERLSLDKEFTRRIEMKPAPEIRFAVLTPEGEPAEGSDIQYFSPKELGNIYGEYTRTDKRGEVTRRYPAQGELAQVEVTHETGRAVMAIKDLPKPITIEEEGESKEVIRCEVRLNSDTVESADIQVQLAPGIFRDGRQWLNVVVSNDSADQVTTLEPGGVPPEILVDNVAYRWTPSHTPAEIQRLGGRRNIRPGGTNYGGEFTLDENWVAIDGSKKLQLIPGNHTVRAVLYATHKDREERGPTVLSNPVEIGSDGQVVGARDVRIRVLGGAEKKPLEGLELTLTPSGQKESLTVTTREGGDATFKLQPGSYRVGIRSAQELPYLPMIKNKAGSHQRGIGVADTPGVQQIEYNVVDPCELVLRAVDADTGRGVSGVVFGTENAGAEYWAMPIWNETIGAYTDYGRSKFNHESLRTDEGGYYRCLVSSRPGWTYFIWITPPGYEMVGGRKEVSIETPVGKRKAEHTFLVRRTKENSATGKVL